jgi:hypothetical protein
MVVMVLSSLLVAAFFSTLSQCCSAVKTWIAALAFSLDTIFLLDPPKHQHAPNGIRGYAFLQRLSNSVKRKTEVFEGKNAVKARRLARRIVSIAGLGIDMHGLQEPISS